jgi:hypothetical protein
MLDLDPLSPLGSILNANLKSRYTRAKDVAETHASTIRRVADALLEHREMDGSEISKFFDPITGGDTSTSHKLMAVPSQQPSLS